MTQKIKVKGKLKHDLYKWRTKRSLNGVMSSVVSWNFQKYLVGKNGELIDLFPPKTPPLSENITKYLV